MGANISRSSTFHRSVIEPIEPRTNWFNWQLNLGLLLPQLYLLLYWVATNKTSSCLFCLQRLNSVVSKAVAKEVTLTVYVELGKYLAVSLVQLLRVVAGEHVDLAADGLNLDLGGLGQVRLTLWRLRYASRSYMQRCTIMKLTIESLISNATYHWITNH